MGSGGICRVAYGPRVVIAPVIPDLTGMGTGLP